MSSLRSAESALTYHGRLIDVYEGIIENRLPKTLLNTCLMSLSLEPVIRGIVFEARLGSHHAYLLGTCHVALSDTTATIFHPKLKEIIDNSEKVFVECDVTQPANKRVLRPYAQQLQQRANLFSQTQAFRSAAEGLDVKVIQYKLQTVQRIWEKHLTDILNEFPPKWKEEIVKEGNPIAYAPHWADVCECTPTLPYPGQSLREKFRQLCLMSWCLYRTRVIHALETTQTQISVVQEALAEKATIQHPNFQAMSSLNSQAGIQMLGDAIYHNNPHSLEKLCALSYPLTLSSQHTRERNLAMANTILTSLEGEERCLFAVGALHLVYFSDSITAILRERGVRVTHVLLP